MWFIRYYILAKIVISAEVITLLRNQSVTCVVTENSVNAGIYINPVIATDFDKQLNNLDWNNDDWNWTDSTKKFFAPVVDERWTTFVTKNSSKYLNLLLVPISISICLNNNSKVAVWNDATFEKFYNKPFFITKINSLPERPSCQWFHYTLTNSRGKLFLNENGNTTLFRPVYERKPLNNLIKFQDFWKMHYYKFRFSNKPSENNNKSSLRLPFSDNPCLSMFVSVDVDCYLNITLEINNTINTEMIIGFNKKGYLKHWKKIEMRVDPSGNGSLSFLRGHLKNYKTGFWAVDNIRFCNKNFKTYTTQLPITSSSQYACKELRNSKKSNNPFCEEIGYLGLNCNISCATVLGPSFATCQNYKICSNDDINSCFCSWGYQGSTCSEECNKGYYGIKCDKKCNSKCEDCNHIKGCVKCKANYFGDNCNDMLQYEVSNDRVHMRWERPLGGNPQHYTLKYECQNYYCPSNNSFIVNTTTITIKLPYSATCDLELYAQLESKSQFLDKITVITRNYTDTDKTELPTNITFVQTSVKMYLKDCTSLNGTISYQLKLRCLSEWCLNETANREIVNVPEYFSYINQTFGSLSPFTRYSLTITITKDGNTINHLYPEFTTPPGIPHQVKDLTIYSKNSSTLWIKWLPPDPPTGNILSYNISYQGADMNSQQNSSWSCKLWKTYLCTTITKLKENMKYTVNIQAKNFGVDEWSRPSNVTAFTNEEESEAPKTIIPHFITNMASTVNLTWTHPSITNGPLKKFHIQVEEKNNATSYELPISECQEMYEYTLSVEYLKEYVVSVWAENKFQGKKANISLTIMSPIPEISPDVPFIESCSGGYCDLFGPKHTLHGKEIDLKFVVARQDRNISEVLQILNNNTVKSADFWTVQYSNASRNYFQLKIGRTHGKAVSLKNQTHTLYLITNSNHSYSLRYPVKTKNANGEILLITISAVTFSVLILLSTYYAFIHPEKKNIHEDLSSTEASEAEETETLIKSLNQNFIDSKYIKMKDLKESFNSDLKCNEIEQQYEMVPNILPEKCTFECLPVNFRKNRYNTGVCCDATRVVLRNSDNGDYINANFLDGYSSKKAFIATQAPLSSTLEDFWLMILQESVKTVVMLTSLVESGKSMCAKYWPDHKSEIRCGTVLVKNSLTKKYDNYIYRKLTVDYKNETRVVEQLQYTKWAHDDEVLNVKKFALFTKKIFEVSRDCPIVIHCSTGCGRTGTAVLCDIALRMALVEQKVNFLKVLVQMREQRAHLVSSIEQYIFAHRVVSHCLNEQSLISTVNDFSIPINANFHKKIEKALENYTLPFLMDKLKYVHEQYRKTESHSQVLLSTSSKDTSCYVEAISVDCYLSKNRFIVMQQPLQDSINEFWKIILEHKIRTIISLNEISDENYQDQLKFWPSDNSEVWPVCNSKRLYFQKESVNDEYKEITLKVHAEEDSIQTVTLIEMKFWKPTTLKPEKVDNLIHLWKKIKHAKSITAVTCYNGTTASGLFVALAYLLEKIDVEHVCDVFSAVKVVQQSRVQFVQNLEQLRCLYRLSDTYVEVMDRSSRISGNYMNA